MRDGYATALDGGTLRMQPGDYCVRLWALEAPEIHTPGGPASRATLDDLINNEIVSCHDLGTRSDGQVVARCTAKGADLGEAMLYRGQAYTKRSDLNDDVALPYLVAEGDARKGRRGLWNDSGDGDKAYAAWRAVLTNPGMESFGIFLGAWQTLIAAMLALVAAAWTVREIRRQTNFPIVIANTEKLLTRKSSLITLKEELALMKGGLETLKADSNNLYADVSLAKRYMPFWLHFPKAYDLCETTQAEIGVDFGPGGAKEFAKVRGLIRKILRLNYSLKDNAVADFEDARIKVRLRDIQSACVEAIDACNAFDVVLNDLIAAVEAQLKGS